MKNITLSADEALIRKAREAAQRRHSTLNHEFREWLQRYVAGAEASATHYEQLMNKLAYVEAGKSFTRDEFNER